MAKTVCFTGHRPNKLFGYDPKKQGNQQVLRLLKDVVIEIIEDKEITQFISGMALGIDLWSAEIVISLKKQYPQIKLISAVPCKNQTDRWPESSKREWDWVLRKADKVIYVSEKDYTNRCMQERNHWMVDHSDIIIAVWNGSNSGTGEAITYASTRKPILRIDPSVKPLSSSWMYART